VTGQFEPYDPDEILRHPEDHHPKHVLYALINVGIRDRGEAWAKCAYCGEPYQLTEEWSDPTVCSPAHHAAFRASIEEELRDAPGLFSAGESYEREPMVFPLLDRRHLDGDW
jgi:hypothetical protein